MSRASTKPVQVRTVTKYNFKVEFGALNYLLHSTQYNFVSIDTEYPGHMFHAPPTAPWNPASVYSLMKANVDAMKLIQVCITISDRDGNFPDFGTNNTYIWKVLISDFDPRVDQFDEKSIDMLMQQGVDFHYNLLLGISPREFASRMVWCGLVRQENNPVTLITFNGAYDLGYLLKVLMDANLPERLEDFLEHVTQNFGNRVYDVKYLGATLYSYVWGGLESVAGQLGVTPVAIKGNRTASNSLLTLRVFHKIRNRPGLDGAVVEQQAGKIYNLCE